MYIVALISLISSLFVKTQGVNETINDGASTSEIQEPELSDAEKCEINAYIDNLLNLFADRRNDARLNANEFQDHLFTTSYAYASTIEIYLRHGTTDYRTIDRHTQLYNYGARRQFYNSIIREVALETLIESCWLHFRKLSRDVLSHYSSTILSNIFIHSLVQNYSYSDQTILFNRNSSSNHDETNENHGLILTDYDIIPVPLILRFFEDWSESFTMMPNFEECKNNAHFDIFNEILWSSNRSEPNRNIVDQEGNRVPQYLLQYTRLDSLRQRLLSPNNRGNYFRGPEPNSRGPFSPRFNQRNVGIMLTFEYDSELIIDQEHYQELLSLFVRLVDYVSMDSELTAPLERFISGVDLYNSMLVTFSSYDAVPLNINQWEKRIMSEEELSRLYNNHKYFYREKKFWAIRRNFRRSKRSATGKDKKEYSMKQLTHNQWTNSIMYLMNNFLKNRNTNKSVPWSDDFARLYLEYRSSLLKKTENHCFDNRFSTFLYSKISHLQEWSLCVTFNHSTKPSIWCKAWRRIMINSADIITLNKTRPEQFDLDLKIFVHWLRIRFLNESQNQRKLSRYGYIIGSPNNFNWLLSFHEKHMFL